MMTRIIMKIITNSRIETPLHSQISLGNSIMSKSINISFHVQLHETLELFLKMLRQIKTPQEEQHTTISLYMCHGETN